jgi:hypothetical protein
MPVYTVQMVQGRAVAADQELVEVNDHHGHRRGRFRVRCSVTPGCVSRRHTFCVIATVSDAAPPRNQA